MIQEQNFYQCQNSDHEFKTILGVCLNLDCLSLRPYCHFCMQEFHIDHVNDLQDFNSVIKWSSHKLPIYGQLQEVISNFKKILTILNEWSDRMKIDDQCEIYSIGIAGLDRLISKQLILENLEQTIEDLNKSSINILEILQTTNKVVQSQISAFEERKIVITSPQKQNSDTKHRARKSYFNAVEPKIKNRNTPQSPIQVRAQSSTPKKGDKTKTQIKSNVEKRLEEQQNFGTNTKGFVTPKKDQQLQETIKKEVPVIQSVKTEVPQIVQQQIASEEVIVADSKYRFSKTLKFETLKISKNGFVITNSGGFALCEPVIEIGQDVKFGFKINRSDLIFLGVCDNVITSVSGYNLFLSDVGHGSYLISNNGYVYSTLESEINNQKKGFTFGSFDQIIIEVSMSLSKITWIFTSQKKQFSMKIDPNKCLYPCVKLQKHKYSCEPEVEILNF